MKLLLVLLMLSLSGCATFPSSTKDYCNESWSDFYSSWQDCYNQELPHRDPALYPVVETLRKFSKSGNFQPDKDPKPIFCIVAHH